MESGAGGDTAVIEAGYGNALPAAETGDDRYAALNEAQRAAVRHGTRDTGGRYSSSPLLVIAGAGTGKTNTLAHRVAHLILEGVAPERILLLTFSRRAAEEMTRRARRILAATAGPEQGAARRISWAGTFHAVAHRLIRQHAGQLGLDAAFSVLDRGDAADLIDVIRHELAPAKSEESPGRRFPRKDTCLAIYSHRVNTQGSLAATLEREFPWCSEWQDELTRLFRAYVERKLTLQALDYDDLLLYWQAMMDDAGLAAAIASRFDQVLVDEYQDTNRIQAAILRGLRPTGEGLTVVGDDAQAIYSFRAATVENILGFADAFEPPARVVTLEENYRSTQPILDAANALINEGARQYRKSLRAAKLGEGEKPRLVAVADELAQADYVAGRVLAMREAGTPLRHQAVLFRSGHHSDSLELELTRRDIPFVKYGGLKFLEAGHVKDLLSVLRWADNPKNRLAAFRALQLQSGVGPANAARIFTRFESAGHAWEALASSSSEFDSLLRSLARAESPWAGQVGRVREWLEPQLERLYSNAATRIADLVQLEHIGTGYVDRETFLSELALDPPSASGDLAGAPLKDEDYLVLSTVHSAKGQEWDAVYVLNVADGSFPNEFAAGDAAMIEEERRLLYVAMTRAKRELHLVAPLRYYVREQPKRGDRHVYGARSRFLTRRVVGCLEERSWPVVEVGEAGVRVRGAGVDVAGRLRAFWG